MHPDLRGPYQLPPNASDTFSCQPNPIDGSDGPRCYTPQQIQQAYGFSKLISRGIDGRGKTIVIVDAFSNTYIQGDLAAQDAEFGLPAPPSFKVVAPAGSPPPMNLSDPDQGSWAEEITLDVLWAHAMAPGAKIVLDEAKSDADADLYAAEKAAVDEHLGDVMSQSFGENEACVDPTVFDKWQQLYRRATAEGWTVFASSGDSGASQFNCDYTAAALAPGYPAADPNVTGVGGTTLNATDPDGDYVGETAWTEIYGCNPPASDYPADMNCSGGGYSTIFGKPFYQLLAVRGRARGVPDVSYSAGVNGGALTICSACNVIYGLPANAPEIWLFGGTSAGSPQWSALAAEADQLARHDLGGINDNLYGLALLPGVYHSVFNDVTSGNNDVAEIGGEGYNAGPGWDPVTGLGTPKAQNLVPALALTRGF
ncbi:MAG TPA: S53 family peptidase [Gaiellaceae bacterium]|nr:S53 family peptidase [Gaiellaceae bacterium]